MYPSASPGAGGGEIAHRDGSERTGVNVQAFDRGEGLGSGGIQTGETDGYFLLGGRHRGRDRHHPPLHQAARGIERFSSYKTGRPAAIEKGRFLMNRPFSIFLVGQGGIEPPTLGFSEC